MLALGKVEEVSRLLAEKKLSQRKIAAAVGVSRATVNAIARGKRPDYQARLRARLDDERPLGPVERCPTCGGRVYMPCRLCRIRQLKAEQDAELRTMKLKARKLAASRFLVAVRKCG